MNCRKILLLLWMIIPAVAAAQNYFMPYQGSDSIYVEKGRVYDDGGPYQDYSTHCSDTLYIFPAREDKYLKLSFKELNIDQAGSSFSIFFGSVNGDEISFVANPGTIYSKNRNEPIIIVFQSGRSVTNDGFIMDVSLADTIITSFRFFERLETQQSKLIWGEPYPYTSVIYNNGDQTIDYFNHTFYLSSDSILDDQDSVILSQVFYPALEPESQLRKEYELYLDKGLEFGYYYIIAKYTGKNNLSNSERQVTEFWEVEYVQSEEDISISSIDVDSVLVNGQNYNVDIKIHNNGTTESDYVYVGYFLSRDSKLDTADFMIHKSMLYPLSPGRYRVHSTVMQNIGVDTLKSGAYYLIVKIDLVDKVTEFSEENNFLLTQVFYRETGGAYGNIYGYDLMADDTIYTTVFEPYTIRFKVHSDFDLPSLPVHVYLSRDSVLNRVEDEQIQYWELKDLAKGKSEYTFIIYFKEQVIRDFGPGQHYLFLSLDEDRIYREEDPMDNVMSGPVFFEPEDIYDVWPVTCDISADSLLPNQVLSIDFRQESNRPGENPLVLLGIFLSKDTIYDASDPYIYKKKLYCNRNYHISADIGPRNPGDFHMIVYSDCSRAQPERSDENNMLILPFTVIDPESIDGVDVVPQDLHADDTLYAGVKTHIQLECFLSGLREESVSFTFYLCNDSVPVNNEQKTKIYELNKTLIPFDGNVLDFEFDMPELTGSSEYFLRVEADSENLLEENSESNNFSAKRVQFIGNDDISRLSVNGFSLEKEILFANEKLTGSFSLGGIQHLSGDSVFVNMHITGIGQERQPGNRVWSDTIVPAKAAYQDTFRITLHDSLGGKVLMLKLEAMQTGDYLDLNPANNMSDRYIMVKSAAVIDLEVTELVLQDGIVIFPRSWRDVDLYLKNNSSVNLADIGIKLYLSRDIILSEDDVLIEEWMKGNIYPARVEKSTCNFFIPEEIAMGNFYLIASAILGQDSLETTLENNIVCTPVAVKPEKFNYNVSFFASNKEDLKSKEELKVSYVVGNTGNIPSSVTVLQFFLSENQPDPYNGRYLTNTGIQSLGTGEEQTGSVTIELPELDPGVYYLTAIFDREDIYDELSESDNMRSVRLQVMPQEFDLELYPNPGLDTFKVTRAGPHRFFHVVENTGIDPAKGTLWVNVYLSDDNKFDALDDLEIGTAAKKVTLNQNEREQLEFSLNIPEQALVGQYYYIVEIDPANNFRETDESNNLFVVPFALSKPEIDLIPQNVTFSADTVETYEFFQLEFDICNLGSTSTGTEFYSGVYISDDSLFNFDDYRIDYEIRHDSMPGNSCQHVSMRMNIYDEMLEGEIYIFVKADDDNWFDEQDENNLAKQRLVVRKYFPDLLLSSSIPDTNVFAINRPVRVKSLVSNIRYKHIYEYYTLKFIFSEDEYLDDYDLVLNSISLTDFAVVEQRPITTYITITDRFMSPEYYGDYYLLAYLDNDHHITTKEAKRNMRVYPISVCETYTDPAQRPDLSVQDVTMPDEVHSGSEFTLDVKVKNAGEVISNVVELQCYISWDVNLDDSDQKLGTVVLDPIEAGLIANAELPVKIYGNIDPGKYRLFVHAQEVAPVREINLANNNYSEYITVKSSVNLQNISIAEQVKLFPNPTKDFLHLSSPLEIFSYSIIDISGRMIQSGNLHNYKTTLNISNLKQGTYFMQLITSEGAFRKTFSVVK